MSDICISMIAAASSNHVIGQTGEIPWRSKADMRYFREQTLGKTVIMGRRTFESLDGRPLSGRTNIVVTKNVFWERC